MIFLRYALRIGTIPEKIINDKEKKKHYVTYIFKRDPTVYTNRKYLVGQI